MTTTHQKPDVGDSESQREFGIEKLQSVIVSEKLHQSGESEIRNANDKYISLCPMGTAHAVSYVFAGWVWAWLNTER